jgi:hypothetical protein
MLKLYLIKEINKVFHIRENKKSKNKKALFKKVLTKLNKELHSDFTQKSITFTHRKKFSTGCGKVC